MFQQHRPVLLGVAYRMLGSFADAEDVVQEAWLRWSGVDHAAIHGSRQFLVAVVSRLAIDRMRLVYRRRETYVGTWLPEPVRADEAGPADTVAQRDTLSLATLRLMEQLTPPERGVYVLREAFELPYEEIAGILGLRADHTRQLHRRGVARLAAERSRFPVDPGVHHDLVEQFLVAARTGDRAGLQRLLAHDVTLWTDGGGKVSAALRPVSGADKVARLFAGTIAKRPGTTFRMVDVNGEPGVLVRRGSRWQVCALEIADGRIAGVLWISNPDKMPAARWAGAGRG
ncbi:RNA polymerase sigma factor SigJ [Actinoplanes sp. TBRC 11911]|nr:RNA polymerase sigma factor SigJ [Actinoplanes sp. TBRC 11911]